MSEARKYDAWDAFGSRESWTATYNDAATDDSNIERRRTLLSISAFIDFWSIDQSIHGSVDVRCRHTCTVHGLSDEAYI